MLSQEQWERTAIVAATSIYLTYSRWINPDQLTQFWGNHIARANLEHAARGFVMPWFGSLVISLGIDALEPNNQNDRRFLRNFAPIGYGILGLTIWTLASEILTQPAFLHRQPQWDQIAFEVGACTLGILSERAYRHINRHRIRP